MLDPAYELRRTPGMTPGKPRQLDQEAHAEAKVIAMHSLGAELYSVHWTQRAGAQVDRGATANDVHRKQGSEILLPMNKTGCKQKTRDVHFFPFILQEPRQYPICDDFRFAGYIK